MIKHIYDEPITNEEIINAAKEAYEEGVISAEQLQECVNSLQEKQVFDGKLKPEELQRLHDAGFTEKQIQEIEKFVYDYRDSLNGFSDLVGDDLVPTKQFLFNMKHIGYLLDNDPKKVLSKVGIKLKGLTTARLVKLLGENFMTSKVIFEDRNELLAFAEKKSELESQGIIGVNPIIKDDEYSKDSGVKLPKGPVIFAPNHYFKDDALATVKAAGKSITFMFGSIPLYFNTTDGILTYLINAILINRKNENSRKATIPKANLATDLGANLFWAPEGVHNKTPNLLTLDFYNGVYKICKGKNVPVVPIIHYLVDPTQKILPHELNPIHTVVDDPIYLGDFSEKDGLDYLRHVISSWYYIMMEKYGSMSREDLNNAYKLRENYYLSGEASLQGKTFTAKEKELLEELQSCQKLAKLENRTLTAHEIALLYGLDYLSTVSGYDSSIEAAADYRPKDIVRPEDVFEPIQKIKNPKQIADIAYASELVRTRKREDYQRRF